MTVYPELRMDGTADVSLARCMRGVPLIFGSEAGIYRHSGSATRKETTDQLPQPDGPTMERETSMSVRHVFSKNYLNSAGSSRSKRSPEMDRMSDVFSRSEKLLLADGNVRSRSRTKSLLYSDDTVTLPSCTTSAKSRKASANYRIQHSESVNSDSPRKPDGTLTRSIEGQMKEDSMHHHIVEPNTSNNASREEKIVNIVYGNKKKLKKHRKRPKSALKSKKVKQGRVSVPATGFHLNRDRHTPMHPSQSLPQHVIRVSSEPPSKGSPYMSYTHLGGSVHQPSNDTRTNHREISHSVKHQILTATTCTSMSEANHNSLQVHAQSKPLVSQSESDKRTYSASRDRSEHCNSAKSIKDTTSVKSQSAPTPSQFGLTTKSLSSSSVKNGPGVNRQSSPVHAAKESSLVAIYAPPGKNSDDFGKIRKIFLSDKQSASIKDCGAEVPCAPPATPTADVLKRYEYVPCMNDVRSQQAVRNRLRVMERDAQKRLEKQKESRLKLDKQMSKDREKNLKAKQRLEIYALNKVMTDLEYQRFKEFCSTKGLKT